MLHRILFDMQLLRKLDQPLLFLERPQWPSNEASNGHGKRTNTCIAVYWKKTKWIPTFWTKKTFGNKIQLSITRCCIFKSVCHILSLSPAFPFDLAEVCVLISNMIRPYFRWENAAFFLSNVLTFFRHIHKTISSSFWTT